jgi:ATP phosphoribosyltransferase regulatory subunit
VSDGVITFNDVGGKLLALKPDVTLSIIKNSSPDALDVERYYYNENVYRISKGSNSYKEIMQTGVECIGNITADDISQVLVLAAKSLQTVSDDFKLHVSSVSLLNALLCEYEIPINENTLTAIADKNFGEFEIALNENQLDVIKTLITSYNDFKTALAAIKEIANSDESVLALNELCDICAVLEAEGFKSEIKIDFSIINDLDYYTGTVFNGFIDGIPKVILSGGRYDGLVEKFGAKVNAEGFAIYLDDLLYLDDKEEYDVDVLLLYDKNSNPVEVMKKAEEIKKSGESVRIDTVIPSDLSYRRKESI